MAEYEAGKIPGKPNKTNDSDKDETEGRDRLDSLLDAGSSASVK